MPNIFIEVVKYKRLFLCKSVLLSIAIFWASKLLAQNNTLVKAEMVHLDTLINSYRYNNPDSALVLIKKGFTIAKQNSDPTGRAMMLNQLGMLNDNQGKYAEAKKNYQDAFNIYKYLHSYKGMATETYRMGVSEARTGKFDRAIEEHLTALSYSEKIKDRHGIIEANLGLTESYIPQHNYVTALNYLKKADSANTIKPFQNLTLNIDNAYGVIYRETGNYKQASKYVLQGLAQSNSPKFNGSHITLLNTLATIYLKQGDVQHAISMQKQALEKSRQINNFLREMESLFNLASSYLNFDPEQSLKYLVRANQLAIAKDVPNQQINACEKMAAVYEKMGNYPKALYYTKELFKLADRQYYKKMNQQITSLQAGYELNKSRSKVRELELINRRDQRDRSITIGIFIGLTAVFLFIGYLFYKLRFANGNLATTNTIKDKLLSVMAHDLRAPFISFINLLRLIRADGLDRHEELALLEKLELSSIASLDTLDSILKWGQTQMKGLNVDPVMFELKPVIDQTMNLLAEAAEKKEIVVRNFSEAGVSVFADIEQIRFVMRNLFSNAIKFSPQGGKIHVLITPDTEKNVVTISVIDNGVGIPADKLQHIFDLDNVSTSGTFNEKGTSMGLLMCKQFIEANHGNIHVSSKTGEGSEFYFTLPMRNDT